MKQKLTIFSWLYTNIFVPFLLISTFIFIGTTLFGDGYSLLSTPSGFGTADKIPAPPNSVESSYNTSLLFSDVPTLETLYKRVERGALTTYKVYKLEEPSDWETITTYYQEIFRPTRLAKRLIVGQLDYPVAEWIRTSGFDAEHIAISLIEIEGEQYVVIVVGINV